MSRSPYFYVEKLNRDTGEYELQHPYVWNETNTEKVPADLYPYPNSIELFGVLENKDVDGYPPLYGNQVGLPIDACYEIKQEYIKNAKTLPGGEVRFPDAKHFTYADMYIYLLRNPFFEGELEDGTLVEVPNPFLLLKTKIDSFLDICGTLDEFQCGYGDIRIIYWIL